MTPAKKKPGKSTKAVSVTVERERFPLERKTDTPRKIETALGVIITLTGLVLYARHPHWETVVVLGLGLLMIDRKAITGVVRARFSKGEE